MANLLCVVDWPCLVAFEMESCCQLFLLSPPTGEFSLFFDLLFQFDLLKINKLCKHVSRASQDNKNL